MLYDEMKSYMDFVLAEINGLYGQEIIREMNEIIKLYNFYDGPGQNWIDDKADYETTKKKTNYVKKLIKEESRFLFGKTPEFIIKSNNNSEEDANKEQELNTYINKILTNNLFSEKLVKGARDAFIGKRVAIKLHADAENKTIKIMFLPSLEFVFEPFEDNQDELKKIIFFYNTNEEVERDKQRVWKQKYEMINGRCYLSEGIYNGWGEPKEIITENVDLQLSGIPAYVVINDGLTGDLKGESDVVELMDNQTAYNKMASEDIDSLRKGMSRIIYGVDVSPEASEKFQIKPGAYWDVETDPTAAEGKQAVLNTIGTDFGYGDKIQETLKRAKSDMYEILNIPNITNEELKGMMTSGKSMKALYWQLITRCEEKMMAWRPALTWMIEAILELTRVYNIENIPELTDYQVIVDNQYPLQEDEYEEIALDLQKVNSQAMSRKSFIKKWQGCTDDVADEELKQIALEREMLEESYTAMTGDDGINE